MESRGHYSTCNESRAHFDHQDSRTMLLRDTSVSTEGDDDGSQEETVNAALSGRRGSDQSMSSAASFNPRPLPPGTAIVFPRRNSFQDRRQLPSRRQSLPAPNRPLPSLPTPYENVDHNGNVQNRATRSASVPNDYENHEFKTSARTGQTPRPPPMASQWRARCHVCFAIIVCCLSVCASALSVYTYLMACRQGQDSYCLPCSDLTQPPKNKGVSGYQLTTKEEGGQELCCVHSNDELAVLVAQVQQNEKMNYAESQNMTSAHVGLYTDRKDRKARSFNIGTHYTLLISPEPFLRHCRNVLAGEKTLTLLVTGRYFVYSSIHFNLNEYHKTCRELEYKTWVHRVYVSRGSPSDVTALLRSEHTCCEECTLDRTSGFTGGIFQLYAGDEIFVDVSAPPLVIDSKETSYMGLFLINKE